MNTVPKYDTAVVDPRTGLFRMEWFRYLTRKPAITSEKEIANGTTLEIKHRLGRPPDKAQLFLVCKEADLGYTVDRRVWIGGFEDASDHGASVSADLENIYVTVGANGIRLMQLSGSVGQFAAITNGRWRIVAVVE